MKTDLTPPAIIKSHVSEEETVRSLLEVIQKSNVGINECKRTELFHYRDIGQSMESLKEYTLRKGIDWEVWCKEKTGYDSERAAKYMKLFKNWDIAKNCKSLNSAMDLINSQKATPQVANSVRPLSNTPQVANQGSSSPDSSSTSTPTDTPPPKKEKKDKKRSPAKVESFDIIRSEMKRLSSFIEEKTPKVDSSDIEEVRAVARESLLKLQLFKDHNKKYTIHGDEVTSDP